MDLRKEIDRRNLRIKAYQKELCEKNEEILALRQLLDCSAANIALLVKEEGGIKSLSRKQVSEALGKYHLSARADTEGNYILELVEE
ncbi:MAG: hypothetical protein IJZ81_04115 [Clostridia bacterium]|nr:hypothetical protein [Clostridia bacterium]